MSMSKDVGGKATSSLSLQKTPPTPKQNNTHALFVRRSTNLGGAKTKGYTSSNSHPRVLHPSSDTPRPGQCNRRAAIGHSRKTLPSTPKTMLFEGGERQTTVEQEVGRVQGGKRRCLFPPDPPPQSHFPAFGLRSSFGARLESNRCLNKRKALPPDKTQPRKGPPHTSIPYSLLPPNPPGRKAGSTPPRSYAPVLSSGHALSTWIERGVGSKSGDEMRRDQGKTQISSAAEKYENINKRIYVCMVSAEGGGC